MPLDLFDIDSFLDDVEDEQWQRERLRSFIENNNHLPPEELIKVLLMEV